MKQSMSDIKDKNTPDAEQDGAGNDRYILSSVDGALSILGLFFDAEELSVSDVAKETGVSRSTAFRFMITLENRGFVSRTSSGKYRLGLKLFSLGMLAYSRMELVSAAHPILADMARVSGETCHIGILEDGLHIIFIDKALGSSRLKMDTPIGYRNYAHCTASGKVILAWQSEQVINRYIRHASFERLTETTISDAQKLLRELDSIKHSGYATDSEEAELGLTCYAMPLLDSGGTAFASISISGPTTRMTAQKTAHLEMLRRAADDISKLIKN